VARFRPGSSREQNSQTSLGSRLHTINQGPMGVSLNSDAPLDPRAFDRWITIFEIGMIPSHRDQTFLAEIVLNLLWQHDKKANQIDEDKLKRLIVVEEAHRYLSEDRPPAQKGERTLLELAIVEARSYGWGFLIIDQIPSLLSWYVWSNCGTILAHRLTELKSYQKVREAMGGDPTPGVSEVERFPLVFRLPENLVLFRRYAEPSDPGPTVGSMIVPRVDKS
jgi:DNA helicase HerA-like ATPase